jgi:hypothetical protein
MWGDVLLYGVVFIVFPVLLLLVARIAGKGLSSRNRV